MKKMIGIWVLILATLILGGCTQSTPTLKIGVMSDVGAVPFYMAKEQGYFDDLGLDVEITVFKSALDRDTALQTGNLDGAMADMLTVFFYNQAGYEVTATSQTYGNYKLVTSPDLDRDQFLALENKQIGLSSNTVIDYATSVVAQNNNFKDSLDKVAIPQMPVRLEMLKSGELNGATLPEPLASAALLAGGTIIGSTEDEALYPGIFIADTQMLKDKSDSFKKLYEGYNQAVDYLNQTDQSVYFDILVENLGFPEALKDSFEMPVFEKAKSVDKETFIHTENWMKDNALLKNDYDYETLTDDSFLE